MNDKDKKILTRLQKGIPLVSEPFRDISKELSLDEGAVLESVKRLIDEGVIRQISPVFETEKMNYSSTLIAAKVKDEEIGKAAEFISSHPGVTHNYERRNEYNLWFTLTLPTEIDFKKTLDVFRNTKGVERIMSLPRLKTFKIRVAFDLTGESGLQGSHKRELKNGHHGIERVKLLKVIKALQRTLPLSKKPFDVLCKNSGLDESEFLDIVKTLYDYGVIRRFPAMTRHKKIGFTHNALIVWKTDKGKVDMVGEKFSALSYVTHCYERRTYPEWPYTLYTMTHARSSEELSKIVQEMVKIADSADHLVLESLKEYKKTRVVYFDTALDEWNRKYL